MIRLWMKLPPQATFISPLLLLLLKSETYAENRLRRHVGGRFELRGRKLLKHTTEQGTGRVQPKEAKVNEYVKSS